MWHIELIRIIWVSNEAQVKLFHCMNEWMGIGGDTRICPHT